MTAGRNKTGVPFQYAKSLFAALVIINGGVTSFTSESSKSIINLGLVRHAWCMVYNATDAPDLSGVSDAGFMFRNAEAFDGDVSSWDVSGVTDMNSLFRGADAFNGDVSSWDVSGVTDMSYMFRYAVSFDSDIS